MGTKQLTAPRAGNAGPIGFESLEARRLLAVHIWTGAVDGNWSNPSNWQGGAPAPGESAIELDFPADAQRFTTTNDIGDLPIDALRLGAGSYQIQGQPLTLTGRITADLTAGSHRIANPIRLADNVRIETAGASSTDGLALILNGPLSGSGGITKFGHNLRLNADNTYTGSTVIEGGGISINGRQPQSDLIIQSGEVSGRGRIGNLTFGAAFGSLGTPVQPAQGLVFDGLPIIDGDLALTEATFFRPVLGAPGGTQIVNGTVSLGGATLSATYIDPPAIGDSFILLANDGTDPINGTFAGLPEGATFTILDREVAITYTGGDGNDIALTVLGSDITTHTLLTASSTVVEPGQGITLSAQVQPGNAPGVITAGSVQFFRDDVLLATVPLDAAGRATLSVTDLPLRGSVQFHAVYSGDSDQALLPSRSEGVRVRVILAGQTETQLFLAPPSGFAGESALIIARVVGLGIPAGTPTGHVELFINDRSLGTFALDGEGRAQLQTADFPIGPSEVRAVYSGDGTFTPSQATASRLTRLIQGRFFPTLTTLTLSGPRSNLGQPITLTATVARLPGQFDAPLGGTVNFYDGSTLLGTAPIGADGQAILPINTLAVGPHALAARYNGNAHYLTSASGVHAHSVSAGPTLQPQHSATAALSALADVDRDGRTDLVWHDPATGDNFIHLLDATGSVRRTVHLPSISDPRWLLEGAGIYNGLDQVDLVWRNQSTGRLLLWRVDERGLIGLHPVPTTPLAAGWRVAGTGDIDRDGNDDLVWRNDHTGQAVVWFMVKNTVRSVTGLGPVARNLDWRLDAVGDVDGDGHADLLWTNQQTHRTAAWLMRGTNFLAFHPLGPAPGAGWRFIGLADVHGDEAPELVLRHAPSGAVQTWVV